MHKNVPPALGAAAAAAVLLAGLLAGKAVPQGGPKLQADDILEIRQLMDAYPRILENCTNGGHDYADLFTEDGTFGVSSTWGGGAKIWFRGRDELAVAGGGGKNGCRQGSSTEYHVNINPTITPTAEGAKATSTLLTITNATTERGDIVHWEGGYEDTFAKTPRGWRFKSRVHVWPEVKWTDRPEDMPPRNLADE
ncbi:MAG TPA: nuclear transport factor 2 family protein [Gammaproteobacteria bacterium]|nr:nuclear transport factor 2 family protein [Gammaproteobacteria bacterium]